MSRSYKKHMGDTICGNSDKEDRIIYHRSYRRMVKRNCAELTRNYEINQIFESQFDLPTDRIASGVDYSCTYADNWSWSSDGGSYLMETETGLIEKFDSEVFGLKSDWRQKPLDVWQRYEIALKDNGRYTYDFVDLVVATNMPKKCFQCCDELIAWFRENQKRIIQLWKKINYGK